MVVQFHNNFHINKTFTDIKNFKEIIQTELKKTKANAIITTVYFRTSALLRVNDSTRQLQITDLTMLLHKNRLTDESIDLDSVLGAGPPSIV